MSDFDEKVIAAAQEYLRRQRREVNPAGKFDGGGRWYPAPDEVRDCCARIRPPSRRFPYSVLVHCRTAEHVANLFGVSAADVRRAAKMLVILETLAGNRRRP